MHLNGKRLCRIDQLDQQRELSIRLCTGAQVMWIDAQVFRQRLARIRTIFDHGGAIGMAAQLPALSQGRHLGLFAKVALEPVSTPQVVLKCRLEQQWLCCRLSQA